MNGPANGSGKPFRPELMRRLGVAYWASIPLEIIEHRISLASETDRVYYGLIRCAFCYPHQSAFAVRPRLKRGGFAAWCAALHERLDKRGPIREGDLYEEETEFDDDGQPVPLTQKDLCAITRLKQPNVSRAMREARKNNLLAEGVPLYPVAKPSAVPPDPGYISADIRCDFGLHISADMFPADPEACARGKAELRDISAEWKKVYNPLRARFRQMAREACARNGFLIDKKKKRQQELFPKSALPKRTPTIEDEADESFARFLAEFPEHPSAPEVVARLAARKKR